MFDFYSNFKSTSLHTVIHVYLILYHFVFQLFISLLLCSILPTMITAQVAPLHFFNHLLLNFLAIFCHPTDSQTQLWSYIFFVFDPALIMSFTVISYIIHPHVSLCCLLSGQPFSVSQNKLACSCSGTLWTSFTLFFI